MLTKFCLGNLKGRDQSENLEQCIRETVSDVMRWIRLA
jgi:hypothetical protein